MAGMNPPIGVLRPPGPAVITRGRPPDRSGERGSNEDLPGPRDRSTSRGFRANLSRAKSITDGDKEPLNARDVFRLNETNDTR